MAGFEVTPEAFRDIHLAEAYPLNVKSREALVSLSSLNGVKVFLTGHNHRFAARPIPVQSSSGEIILEFQAATALKRPPAGESRGFYVHQLVLDEHEKLWWNTWAYRWRSTQFLPLGKTPDYTIPMS